MVFVCFVNCAILQRKFQSLHFRCLFIRIVGYRLVILDIRQDSKIHRMNFAQIPAGKNVKAVCVKKTHLGYVSFWVFAVRSISFSKILNRNDESSFTELFVDPLWISILNEDFTLWVYFLFILVQYDSDSNEMLRPNPGLPVWDNQHGVEKFRFPDSKCRQTHSQVGDSRVPFSNDNFAILCWSLLIRWVSLFHKYARSQYKQFTSHRIWTSMLL